MKEKVSIKSLKMAEQIAKETSKEALIQEIKAMNLPGVTFDEYLDLLQNELEQSFNYGNKSNR